MKSRRSPAASPKARSLKPALARSSIAGTLTFRESKHTVTTFGKGGCLLGCFGAVVRANLDSPFKAGELVDVGALIHTNLGFILGGFKGGVRLTGT